MLRCVPVCAAPHPLTRVAPQVIELLLDRKDLPEERAEQALAVRASPACCGAHRVVRRRALTRLRRRCSRRLIRRRRRRFWCSCVPRAKRRPRLQAWHAQCAAAASRLTPGLVCWISSAPGVTGAPAATHPAASPALTVCVLLAQRWHGQHLHRRVRHRRGRRCPGGQARQPLGVQHVRQRRRGREAGCGGACSGVCGSAGAHPCAPRLSLGLRAWGRACATWASASCLRPATTQP